jgi:hypothetical protein
VWPQLIELAKKTQTGDDIQRADVAIMDAVVTLLTGAAHPIGTDPTAAQVAASRIRTASRALPADAVDAWRDHLVVLADRHPAGSGLRESIRVLASAPIEVLVPETAPPVTASPDVVGPTRSATASPDVAGLTHSRPTSLGTVARAALRELSGAGAAEHGYAYLDAADNAGRRAALIRALPFGPAVIEPLARLAGAQATTVGDLADANSLELLADALNGGRAASEGTRGIVGLGRGDGAAYQWMRAVSALKPAYPQHVDALNTLLARKFAPCA